MSQGLVESLPRGSCRACNCMIVWATLETGGKIPLDPKPPVYKVTSSYDEMTGVTTVRAERKLQSLVSHFATCKDPNRFSGSKR